MVTLTDLKLFLKYFSDNYVICQHTKDDLTYFQLLLKDDVNESFIQSVINRKVVDIPDFVNTHRNSEIEYLFKERRNNDN